jgi:class 3 adenylate cyclase
VANSARRKLAAILAANAVGYVRLARVDEASTHCRLSSYLDAITGLIDRRNGKVMHFAGDAVLANEPMTSNKSR